MYHHLLSSQQQMLIPTGTLCVVAEAKLFCYFSDHECSSTQALIGVCPFELIETIASAVASLLQKPEISEQREH